MVKTKVTMKQKVNTTSEVMKSLNQISGMDILVGIPDENAEREEGDVNNAQLVMYHTKGVRANSMIGDMGVDKGAEDSIYNSALSLYIASHGSPLWRVPPRPIIEPALEASGNKERIEEDLKNVLELMLDGKRDQAIRAMHVAGADGVNIIKSWFQDSRNGWVENAPSTVMAKINKKYKSKKARSKRKAEYLAGNTEMNEILVDTGAMKNAMTYVLDIVE